MSCTDSGAPPVQGRWWVQETHGAEAAGSSFLGCELCPTSVLQSFQKNVLVLRLSCGVYSYSKCSWPRMLLLTWSLPLATRGPG